MRKSKKAQITIFIIFALIIIVLVALFFLLKNPPEIKIVDENNPQAYIESCVRESVEEAISILSPRGGDIDPKGNILYGNIERTYLCYTGEYYKRCVNQRPILDNHIEEEITNYITPIVKDCFKYLESKLERRYDIETSEMKLKTNLYPDQVTVNIEKYIKMTRGDEIRELDYFRMTLVHPIYNFAKISMEIVNQEIRYCDFDELGFMIVNTRYDVDKKITGNSDIIYTLKERSTNQEFKFAVRNCVLPPGY